METLLLVAIGWLGLAVSYIGYYRFWHPLARHPGPFLASLTNVWSARLAITGDWHTRLAKLHEQYGPIVRIAPNEVAILDVEACKTIYAAGSGFVKTEFYRAFNDPQADHQGTANLFSARNEAFHSARRRQVGNAYTMKSLLGFREYVEDVVKRFVDRLDRAAASHATVDLGHDLARLACDIAAELSFGGGLQCIEGDPLDVIPIVEQSQMLGAFLGRIPALQHVFFHPLIQRLLSGSPPSKTFRALGDLADQQVQAHIANPEARHDMLSLVLETAQRSADKKTDDQQAGLPLDSINLETLGIVMAGTDTTSITMTALFHHILNRPDTLARLRAEADQHLSPDEEMPYLRAVLNEVFRIHPAVSWPLPRVVPAGGALLAGHFFPAGTHVGVNAYHLHRLPHVFGDDVETFRPERWIAEEGDADGEQRIKLMERTLFHFGGGAHTCIGRNISLLELRCALPELLRRFDFDLVEPGKPLQIQSVWFTYARHVRVKISPRKQH